MDESSLITSRHLLEHFRALLELDGQAPVLASWGQVLGAHLRSGGRLLAAGNGGSAAQAQHLTAEIVGRFELERQPLSAICLHGDTSALTAIANDYGYEEVFARQVQAHGRPGDILLLLSTSGRSPSVLEAARAGRGAGLRVWALTGPGPNPLQEAADETVALNASTGVVQEVHLVALHMLCVAVEAEAARPRVVRDEEEAG
jgi:phosphoheptose isomerase